MAKLAVNVDHVATVRQVRGGKEPDPVLAGLLAEQSGAEGVVVHLRGDRRHIQERDVRLLRQVVKTMLILEMAATPEMLDTALSVCPDVVTLVPEKFGEVTTEGGLKLAVEGGSVAAAIRQLKGAAIGCTLFVNPDEQSIRTAREVGADAVEIHTGFYAEAAPGAERMGELEKVVRAVRLAVSLGLGANVGHGIGYHNVGPLAEMTEIREYSIGHSIVARAVFVGFPQAVREMVALIKGGWQ
ncbi:MAG: pyridoxine 5'-phosphate synthase [Pseudomonadota bacterium]